MASDDTWESLRGVLVRLGRQSSRNYLALGVTAAVAGVVVAGQSTGHADAPVGAISSLGTLALLFTGSGLLILSHLPRHAVGLLMTAAGGIAVVAVASISWTAWTPVAWLGQWAWWPPFPLIFLALLFFPDGRLPSPRWKPVAVAMALLAVVVGASLAVAAVDHPHTLVTHLPEFTPRARTLIRIAVYGAVLTLCSLGIVFWSLWRRWRVAVGDERSQLRCLLPGAAVLLVGIALDTLGVPWASASSVVAVPVAMTVAVLRYRLFDLDQVVDRTLVWLVMTLVVIICFVFLETFLQNVITGLDQSTTTLVAIGIVAIVFEPLRQRVQRSVDRLVYGDRGDPVAFLTTIGDVAQSSLRPDAVLPSLAAAVARSMCVPYVAVELPGPDGPRIAAFHGHAKGSPEAFEMVAHGRGVGRLLVSPRTYNGTFTLAERRLLGNAALHAAVATEANQLIIDLRESRERLVIAREEERRRLRQDLHDGVGPALAGMGMQLAAARRQVAGQERAEKLLVDLAADLHRCAADMRVLVDRLRPAALDSGLATAVRRVLQSFEGPHLRLWADLPEDLGRVPAAVEVAAYRIIGEALTNVVRHSGADTCDVGVRRDGCLRISVVDNGGGIAAGAVPGEGLASMRQRAAELDGTLVITVPPEGTGTAIHVTLPLGLHPSDGPDVSSSRDGPAG